MTAAFLILALTACGRQEEHSDTPTVEAPSTVQSQMPQGLLQYFDGTETVESLVAEWTNTDREMPLEEVQRNNLIPVRLFYMGAEGQKAILQLPISGIASSNENLVHCHVLAILALGVDGVLISSANKESTLIAGRINPGNQERRRLDALLEKAIKEHPDQAKKIEEFRAAIPTITGYPMPD